MKILRILIGSVALIPALTASAHAQTTRQWSGASSGAWLTTTNWTPSGTYPGVTTAPVAGGGSATDIMGVVSTNTATNVGINMNTSTGGAGGLGLTLGGIDWNKSNTTATVIGNSSTTTPGNLRLDGAQINGVDKTLVRVTGTGGTLTLATVNTGTGSHPMGLVLGVADGVFQVDAGRTLTLRVRGISAIHPGTGFALQGGGTLIAGCPNGLTGPVVLGLGRAQADYPGGFGSGTVRVLPDSQAFLTASQPNSMVINGSGFAEASGAKYGALRFQGGTATSGSVTVESAARVAALTGQIGNLNGSLLGSAPLEVNSPDAGVAGTININGTAAGYSGVIQVSQGRLNVTSMFGPAGPVIVSDGAAIGGESTMTGDLTVGSANGATVHSDGSTTGALTSRNLTVTGVATVLPSGVTASPTTVLKYTGSLAATAANFGLPGGIASYRAGTTFDTSVPGQVRLILPGILTWTGNVTSDWDSVAANWTSGDFTFLPGDCVVFDDSGPASVNIPGTVQPLSIVVDNTTTDRSFSGIGGITGTTSLVKNGSGKLTISTVNSYMGETIVNDGLLEVGAVGAIPSTGTVTVSAGTLRVTPVHGMATTNSIILGDANSGNNPTVVEIPIAATADQVVLSTPVTLNSNASSSKAILRYRGSDTSGGASTFNGAVNLNGRDLWLENASDTGGATQRLWNMYGKISGAGNVHVDVPSPATRVRIGFNGNDFTGNVYIHRGMLQVFSGAGGTNDCIPNTASVYFSAGSRMGLGTSDAMGALIGGDADPEAGLAAALISPNTSSASPTLTIGYADRSGIYGGTMSDESTHLLALTKVGTGTQVLNGGCSNTGATAIQGGKLIINAGYNSIVNVSAFATLGGNGTSAKNFTATATGSIIAPGNSVGTLTTTGNVSMNNAVVGGTLAIEINDASTPKSDKLAVGGTLNITNARLDVSVTGTPSQAAYVIASYGTLTGTFGTVNVPANYQVVYNYNDGVSTNNIALVYYNPYAAWAATKGLTPPNDTKDADADADGVNNGLEFYLDTNPLVPDSPGPVASISGANLRLTYKRRDDAEGENVVVETSTTLAPGSWISAVNGVNGVVFNITENGTDPDGIEVLVPMGVDLKKFGRLRIILP